MKIVPVIDVQGGVVVHAKGGRREEYVPIESDLVPSADPVEIAWTFNRVFGFDQIYIADLDAILGGGPNISHLRSIGVETSMKMMVDAGIGNALEAESILKWASKVVVGSETLGELAVIEEILEKIGQGSVVASVDVVEGSVISRSEELMGKRPAFVAKIFEKVGVRELIFLELERVGSERGADLSEVGRILNEVEIPVMVGGGIRDIDDLLKLRKIGVSGALIATSLHNGNITKEELEQIQSFSSP